MATDTITVLDGADVRAYAMSDLDDEFSRMWEDHYASVARRAGLMARCAIVLTGDGDAAYNSAREAFTAAAKALNCREVRAGRSAGLTMREEVAGK